jgi:hypothetical protein
VRPEQDTDGRDHDAISTTPHDHHAAPELVSFGNTTQSLPPGTTFDLDVTLPDAGYKAARVQLMGPNKSGGGGIWREWGSVYVSTDSAKAMGHSARSGGFKRSYCATYAKSQGDAQLTQKVFNTGTGYISLQDAWITGSTLRLRFRNHFGGSTTLWVKGEATCF